MMAWHPGGLRLASGGGDGDQTVRIWDLTTHEELLSFPGASPVSWSPDGKQLAHFGVDGTIKIRDAASGYRIAQTPRYRLELIHLLIAEQQLDRAIAVLDQLVADFSSTPEYREAVAKARKAIAGAYSDRGDVSVAEGRFEESLTHFDQAIRFDPKYSEAYDHRAQVYRQRRDFDRAIADYSESIRLNPNVAQIWYLRVLAQIACGRRAEYRTGCKEMLDHFGKSDMLRDARWVAWTCALAPDATADRPKVLALAEKAAKSDPKSFQYQTTLGAILYRAVRLEEAVQRLTEADRLAQQPGGSDRSPPAYIWFFLAMSHHRLGHREEAKKWLDKAVAWTEKNIREAEQGTTDLPWNHRLTLKLLREEAEALLKPAQVSPSSKPAAKEKEKPKIAK
jgi:tetratricopeptide (TPR) repeat protein